MQELYPLRPQTHDKFEDMRYDDRYTPLLERVGLDVVSFQVRRGLPAFNPAAILALVDRYHNYEQIIFSVLDAHITVVLLSCFVDGGRRLTAFTYLAVR